VTIRKMIIAAAAILGAMLGGASPQAEVPPKALAQQTSSSACIKGQPHQKRRLADKGWRITIYLDPCVPELDARRILTAIRDGRLVDKQLESRARTNGGRQDIPKIGIQQVLWIAFTEERVSEVAPDAPFSVMIRTTAQSAPPAGLYLLVSVHANEVEVHYVGGWLE